MLGETFDYNSVGKETFNNILTDLYSFKCLYKIRYIIEVEHHKNDIFIIKFFQKNHINSKKRYSLLNSKLIRENYIKKGLNGSKNFLIILNTIIKIIIDTYSSNKRASFGFMGAPTILELNQKKNSKNINEDGTVKETKRYNVYSIYVKRYFSPEIFEHIEIESSSCYMIRSINSNLKTNEIELFFQEYIEEFC